MIKGFRGRHLLGLEELTAQEISHILETAQAMKQIVERDIKKVPTLRGKAVVTVFYEPSTRTRTSFELAAKYLSADTVSLNAGTSSIVKGENLLDTARTIQSMGADAVVLRHPMAGAAHLLASALSASVINAGDGMHEHPTQSLLDLLTIRERKGRIEGLKIAIIGDIAHSRVARSNILGLSKLGATVWVSGPATMIPPGLEAMGATVARDAESAVAGADVVMALRLQTERQQDALIPDSREYARVWGIDVSRLGRAKDDVIIMHPGPMNRGVEIASEVADSPASVVGDQVRNGVAVRMAVLYLLLMGEISDDVVV